MANGYEPSKSQDSKGGKREGRKEEAAGTCAFRPDPAVFMIDRKKDSPQNKHSETTLELYDKKDAAGPQCSHQAQQPKASYYEEFFNPFHRCCSNAGCDQQGQQTDGHQGHLVDAKIGGELRKPNVSECLNVSYVSCTCSFDGP